MNKPTRKTVSIAPVVKPRTADEFVSAGRESPSAPTPEVIKRLTLDVPESLHKRIKRTCADRGEMMADELRKILEREFPA